MHLSSSLTTGTTVITKYFKSCQYKQDLEMENTVQSLHLEINGWHGNAWNWLLMLSSGHSEVMATTAPDYLWLQAKVVSTVSPTLLAASRSKPCSSQGDMVLLLGEFSAHNIPGAKKGAICKEQEARQAIPALLQALPGCPSLYWIACPENKFEE